MTTARKLTIAAAVLLCGAIVVLVVRPRPDPRVTVTLQRLETNQGIVTVHALVSNASPQAIHYVIGTNADYFMLTPRVHERVAIFRPFNRSGFGLLSPAAVATYDGPLSDVHPRWIYTISFKHYAPNWRGTIQAYLDRAPICSCTLEISQ
jgi:hypothetical protein